MENVIIKKENLLAVYKKKHHNDDDYELGSPEDLEKLKIKEIFVLEPSKSNQCIYQELMLYKEIYRKLSAQVEILKKSVQRYQKLYDVRKV